MTNNVSKYVAVSLSWTKFDSHYMPESCQENLEQQFNMIINYFNSLVIPYCVRENRIFGTGSTIILEAAQINGYFRTLDGGDGIPSVLVYNYTINDKQKPYCNYFKDNIRHAQKELDIFLHTIDKYNDFILYMNSECPIMENSEREYLERYSDIDFFEFFRLISDYLDLAIKIRMCKINDTSESQVNTKKIFYMIDDYLDLAIDVGLYKAMIYDNH